LEQTQPGTNLAAGDEIDLQVLGNYVDHNHGGDRDIAGASDEGGFAVTGTRRQLRKK
jgi:hypothetical protein